ncbi:methionine--tRNA ligase [Candidatus Babeliales bacterium]|nr:methionine--tRNA ligase [Candidatus Babeliales bacterium]
MKKPFYVTTPIYYVNAAPHLGTLYSTVIADVTARYQQLHNKEVFFVTGTDEHGQKIADVAKAAQKKPQEFVDSMIEPFKKTWNNFGIDYSHFMRTTDPIHKKLVQETIKTLFDQGDIYKANYEGLYCTPCESFITPSDQTEETTCPIHKKPLDKVSEESYFFRLSSYQDQLLDFYTEHPHFITPKERYAEVISFVKGGLKDLSISRTTVSWGIPFPDDKAHTTYVWIDALMNYISALHYAPGNHDWWPAQVHIMAKDIVRFHAVYWPALLMALKKPLPQKLVVHGYLLMDDQKMSKSLGNSLNPETLAKTYGAESIRYYLMKQIPFQHDGHCSTEDLTAIINADLSNNVGNLLQRTLTLTKNKKLPKLIPPHTWEVPAARLHMKAQETISSYIDSMNHYQFHKALHSVMTFVSETNAYLHGQEPWKLKSDQAELANEVLSATLHALDCIGFLLTPFLPEKMKLLRSTLRKEDSVQTEEDQFFAIRNRPWNFTFNPELLPKPLFPRIEVEKKETAVKKQENKKDNLITIDTFAQVKIAVGTITNCIPVANSTKLLQLTVDLGQFGIRTILSGVAQSYSPESLIEKQGLFIVNLPKRKMAGIASEGMMLFSTTEEGKLTAATVAEKVGNGTLVG